MDRDAQFIVNAAHLSHAFVLDFEFAKIVNIYGQIENACQCCGFTGWTADKHLLELTKILIKYLQEHKVAHSSASECHSGE